MRLQARPLQGTRVIEFAQLAPGPYAGLILAELGAEVIKVEAPAGDPARRVPPMLETKQGSVGAIFCALNRGKKSVQLDLKTDSCRQAYHRLARTAGIIIDGYRPGVAERLGVGFEDVAEDRQDLVYIGLSGFGPEGDKRQAPGHDVTYQALMGGLDPHDGGLPELPVADFTGALWAALLAVAHHHAGGCHHVPASLAGALKAPLFMDHALAAVGIDQNPIRDGLPGYEVYPCQDGKLLALGALEPHFWQSLCKVLGDRELFEAGHPIDPQAGAKATVAQHLASKPRQAWLEAFEVAGVPAEPVLGVQEAFQAPAVTSSVDPPAVEAYEDLAGAPVLGEHTDEVLDALG